MSILFYAPLTLSSSFSGVFLLSFLKIFEKNYIPTVGTLKSTYLNFDPATKLLIKNELEERMDYLDVKNKSCLLYTSQTNNIEVSYHNLLYTIVYFHA